MTGVAASCPQCGAAVRFGGAHSVALACPFCRASLLRDGRDLAAAGKVPDLVAVDTRLAVGATGRAGDRPFAVLGRLQLSRGDATWNEWYADVGGAPGWLAEAQGRLHFTRELDVPAKELPPLPSLSAGGRVELPGAGEVTVEEIGEARLVSFEGELPFPPRIGASYRYADATGDAGAFVTLDYGAEGEEPGLYAGRIVPWSEVKLLPGGPETPAATATALTCPGCGAPVSLRLAESKATTCGACHRILDVADGGLREAGSIRWKTEPVFPLGAKGTLRGEPLEAIGWMLRGTEVEGERYEWQEVLLHGPGGYRWLSVYDGHWLLLAPEPAGAVRQQGADAVRGGRTYRHFQKSAARTLELRGEFYWEARAETVATDDFVSPPYLLSVEGSKDERAWTHGEYLTGAEVWTGLGLAGKAPRAVGVGSAQPNPHGRAAKRQGVVAAVAVTALLAVSGWLHQRSPAQETVLSLEAPLTPGQVTLSEPIELAGGPQAVRVEARANVRQAWVGLDVALIEEETGESDSVGVEVGYWSGSDSDGPWSEGSMTGSAIIGGVRGGRYLLRIEPAIEALAGATVPPTATVWLVRPAFPRSPLIVALLLILALPLVTAVRAWNFERRRWAESDHPWGEES